MKNIIYSIYNKEMFMPNIISSLFNPFYIIRRRLFMSISKYKHHMHGKMLDFGCGKKPYKNIFAVDEYIGVDMKISGHDHKNNQIDMYYDGKTIPFENNHFDSIFSSEVFEHIFNLEDILRELYRVLKPDGQMLITLPFVWDEHEVPYDFARYTSYGIAHLLTKTGFEIVHYEKTSNYVETIFQMWNAYLYQHVFPKNIYLKMLLTPLIIFPITFIALIMSKLLPNNYNFYHNSVIVCKK